MPLIYEVCKKLLKEETYNLIGQMKRAGLSISNNLAKGASRKAKGEKNRFDEISRSSVVESNIASLPVLYENFLLLTI